MSRSSRENLKSHTRVYHIILKGINSQELFLEDNDKTKFLQYLEETKLVYQYEIYAYVLMSNHIHLLIYDKENKISQIMHKICTKYAIYFNKKYERVGHLFQNRFKSKCVDTTRYLLRVQRYIHKNPQKDGLERLEKYKWSSYQEYVFHPKIINRNFILNIFDTNISKAIEKFIEYHKLNDEKEIEFEMKNYLTDEEAITEIKQRLKIKNIMLIQNFSKELRDTYITEIFKIGGISKKQISRITGISSRTIQRAITGR